MLTTLLPVIFLVLLILFWLDGARARELATGISAAACDKRNLQFLDGTVSLSRIGLRWATQGLRIRRMYSFDYSLGGVERQRGLILMLGTQFESIHFPSDGVANETSTEPDEAGKVIPFRHPDQ